MLIIKLFTKRIQMCSKKLKEIFLSSEQFELFSDYY